MFRFISTVDSKILKKRYLAIYGQLEKINEKYSKILFEEPQFKAIIKPKEFEATYILTADFSNLADLYFRYVNYAATLTKDQRDKLNKKFAKIFNYDTYKRKIASFLIEPNNGFPIYNCVYCDLESVRGYTRTIDGKRVRNFDTEHILDRGNCPILGLSLYNFAPSCGLCNDGGHKGTQSLGSNKGEVEITSPTSHKNRFDEEVQFSLSMVSDTISDLSLFGNANDVRISFKGKIDKYSITISRFYLEDRYNAHKMELIAPILRHRKNPKDFIEKMAEDRGCSYDELFQDFFGFRERRDARSPMEKCRREIFMESFGYELKDIIP